MMHTLVWATGVSLLLGLTVRRVRRGGPPLLDALLLPAWTVVWVELGVALMLPHTRVATDAEATRSGWDPVTLGIPEVDRLHLPTGLLATEARRPSREPGTWRIALIGDSFTAGQGVAPEHTLATQLASRLGPSVDGFTPEVLNHGIPGLGTRELVVLAEDETLAWSPDVVVWLHVLNDLPGTHPISRLKDLGLGTRLDDGVVDRTRDGLEPGLWWTGDLVSELLLRRRIEVEMERIYREGHDPALAREALDAFEARLRPIVAEVTGRGGRFVFATWPLMHRLRDYPFVEAHRTMLELAERVGAEPLDLLGPFVGRDEVQLWATREDHHPNAVAQGLAADRLAEHLRSSPAKVTAARTCAPEQAADLSVSEPASLRAAASAFRCLHPDDPQGPLAQARARLTLPRDAEPPPFHRRVIATVAIKQAAALDVLHPGVVDRGELARTAEAVRALD